jgi:hypothetical protein
MESRRWGEGGERERERREREREGHEDNLL